GLDPLHVDSDRDGVQDGTELGLGHDATLVVPRVRLAEGGRFRVAGATFLVDPRARPLRPPKTPWTTTLPPADEDHDGLSLRFAPSSRAAWVEVDLQLDGGCDLLLVAAQGEVRVHPDVCGDDFAGFVGEVRHRPVDWDGTGGRWTRDALP